MEKLIFDKTNKGRDEIATRKHGLAPRMRSLLVLVDGKKNNVELLKKVAGLGLTDQSITELADNGFIENVFSKTTISEAPSNVTPMLAEPSPVATVLTTIVQENNNETISPALPTTSPKEKIPEEEVLVVEVKPIAFPQLQTLHKFFNETIKSTIGLRGFSLQLKAEQATTMTDFRDLRQLYLEAVLKAKGREITISLRDRLDQLLDDAEKSTI